MKRTSINPWDWGKAYQMDQGQVIEGATRRLEIALLLIAVAVPSLAAFHLLRREQQLARLRAGFVQSVSHELRTPLAQIRMFAETLRLGRVRSEEEVQKSLDFLDREARRLQNMVDNVLQFSRAERGALRVQTASRDLAPLVREAVESYRPLAAAQRAALQLDWQPCPPALVDPGAVVTIVLNLLDNAVKYGPRDQTVTVRSASAAGSVDVLVDDQGSGVPGSYRDKIWDRYWRAFVHRLVPVPDEDRHPAVGVEGQLFRRAWFIHIDRGWDQLIGRADFFQHHARTHRRASRCIVEFVSHGPFPIQLCFGFGQN